ncbi:MAG: type VI secretion system baseplate subunit TssK [Endozoicomonas sp. (ex Botrylloides leachii)]|nr:type VI secretion system baseplate subunit TssK [Endozoicomonas sp. (ex Botrylloides leachii)]
MNHSFNKVVWQEGTFLSPQHFQQQERYLEKYSRQLFSILHPSVSGFIQLSIDEEQLKTGKIFLQQACGIFPDGTPFEFKENLVRDILTRDIKNAPSGTIVYLALPLFRSSKIDTAPKEKNHLPCIRQQSYFHSVNDCTNDENESLELEICHLNPSLLLQGEQMDDYSTLAIARIQGLNSNGELVLDSSFIPRCIDYRVSTYLAKQVQNLQALVQQRSTQLAEQVGSEAQLKSTLTMQISYMKLQTLNRYRASFKQIEQQSGITAADLYRYLVGMAADLSTFSLTTVPDFPIFNENAIYDCFSPVISCLLINLSHSSKEKVVSIPWDTRLYDLRRLLRCEVNDRTLYNDGRFILAVSSSIGIEDIRQTFITSSKLCGQKHIAKYVRNSLAAVPLTILPSAPIELRSKPGTVYFNIEVSSPIWQDMIKTNDLIALHVDEQMPSDTNIELFVIR